MSHTRRISGLRAEMRLLMVLVAASFAVAAASAERLVMVSKQRGSTMSKAETIISAPAEFVYPYIVEADKIRRWTKDDALKVAFPKGSDVREGMQIDFTIKLPTDPHWVVEIKHLEAGRRMTTEMVEGIFRGRLDFLLEPQDDGSTKLIHEAQIQPQGTFMKFAWEVAGEHIHEKKITELLGRIAEIVETDYNALAQADRPKKKK